MTPSLLCLFYKGLAFGQKAIDIRRGGTHDISPFILILIPARNLSMVSQFFGNRRDRVLNKGIGNFIQSKRLPSTFFQHFFSVFLSKSKYANALPIGLHLIFPAGEDVFYHLHGIGANRHRFLYKV